MEEPPKVVKITDLPNEVLEMIVPDLEPKTISTLKLVNKRFYNLLSNDRYYQHFLKYPPKYMLSWMKNEKSAGKKVTEEIQNEEIGKWKGYLTLEKLHLENWLGARVSRCEKVPLPPLSFEVSRYKSPYNHPWLVHDANYWQDMIDEDGEHWLLSVNPDGHVVLINVTNGPKVYIEKRIMTWSAFFLCGQVLCDNFKGTLVVFDIVNLGSEISMEYKFTFFIDVIDNWCVSKSYKGNIVVSTDVCFKGLLHFRDLTTGQLLDDVNLCDYECVMSVCNTPIGNDFLRAKLYDKNIEYPYIMIAISRFPSVKDNLVVVFNMENMKPTTFVKIQNPYVDHYSITRNLAFILSSGFERRFEVDVVQSAPLDKLYREEPQAPKTLVSYINSQEIFHALQLIHGKLLLISLCESRNTVSIVSLTESGINMQVTLAGIVPDTDIRFIGPDVLAVISPEKHLKMLRISKGEQGVVVKNFIDWEKTFREHETDFRLARPVLSSMDFSKIVLYDLPVKDNDFLAVFYF